MISMLDIKVAVNRIINNNFDTKVLSNKVKDNFKAPAFFTEIVPVDYDYESKYRNREVYLIRIHHFPKTFNDDIEIMKVSNELRKLFDRKLVVKDRHLNIRNIKERFHEGSLFFTFTLDFQQYKEVEETNDTIQEIITERVD